MVCGIVLILCCLFIHSFGLRDYDVNIVGFSIERKRVEVYYRIGVSHGSRYTDCDGEVNGHRLETWAYTAIHGSSWESYETCVIRIPSSARPVRTLKVMIDSFLNDWEVKNATRWDLDFDMTAAPVSTRVMFDDMPSYMIRREKALTNGKMEVNGIFKMNQTGSRPLYTSFRFDGVDMSIPNAEMADVRIYADDETQWDRRISVKNMISGDTIRSSLKIDESLVQSVRGIRGLMYFGAIFQVKPYLKMTGSINIGFDIYTLYDKFYLFPFGSFAMLEPPRNNAVVKLKRDEYNIIPCLTIGASQFGFKYTPKVFKVNPDGSLSNSTFQYKRQVIGLYYRENSPVLRGNTDGVEGKYACQLNYEIKTDKGREDRSIRRIFDVVVEL